MIERRLAIACLFALLLAVLSVPSPAAGGSRDDGNRHTDDFYRPESGLALDRDHHRGRSFTEHRSRLRDPSYLRREERRRALSENATGNRPPVSDLPSGPAAVSCRTMTSVERIDERPALVTQQECIDASGLTRVTPGSRRVVKFYDE